MTKGGTSTVDTMQFQGFGSVLVNAAGQPLYASDQETNGMVKCNGACSQNLDAVDDHHGLAHRDVGQRRAGCRHALGRDQAGHLRRQTPVHVTGPRFKAGKLNGDGIGDAFGGQRFTWHVVRINASGGTSGRSGGGQSGGMVRGY